MAEQFVVLHTGLLHDLVRHGDIAEAIAAAGEAVGKDRTPRLVVALAAGVTVSPRPQVDVEWLAAERAPAGTEGGAS